MTLPPPPPRFLSLSLPYLGVTAAAVRPVQVYSEMLLLQQREQEMRDISEQTNSRVAWLSFMSLAVCVGAASWQVWYLKKFFQRKKLL